MSNQNRLPRSTPGEQGISSAAIAAFLEAVGQSRLELHSFMLMRHGRVAAEGWWSPYGPERPHMLFSLSKSFTSSAVGLAAAEGRLSVDDRVLSFFPQEVTKEIEDNMADLRIRHLLSMSTGHAEDTTARLREQADGNWVKGFLSTPINHPPGTHFVYNSGASYMLSAIVQKVTGRTLLEYLQPSLFGPLGIEGAAWETCPRGINTGGWGLSLKTEDIARFGQLYLQQGIWNGRRVLPEAWIREATALHISNGDGGDSDWTQGYGYQFWRCRHGAYRGDGAFGQFCIVMPDQDAVMAITSGEKNLQGILNLVWTHLLPAMGDKPLVPDDTAHASLERRLAALAFVPPRTQPDAAVAAATVNATAVDTAATAAAAAATATAAATKVSGKRYELEENKEQARAISFVFQVDKCVFTLWDDQGGQHRIECGTGAWLEGECTLAGYPARIAASGTWCDDHTYVMTWRFVETPFRHTVSCQFDEDRLRLESSGNVSSGPKRDYVLQGRMG